MHQALFVMLCYNVICNHWTADIYTFIWNFMRKYKLHRMQTIRNIQDDTNI